jgi:hypothetical protein
MNPRARSPHAGHDHSPASVLPTVAFYTERDIVQKRGGIISQRVANKQYHALLQANVMIYKTLPKDDRSDFAKNIYNFLTRVCQRRIVQYRTGGDDYVVLDESKGAIVISAAIRDDKTAQACCASNPLWILGHHDPSQMYGGMPFLYRTNNDNKNNNNTEAETVWHHCQSSTEAQTFLLQGHLKNLLVLPSDIDIPDRSVLSFAHRRDNLPALTVTNLAGRDGEDVGDHDEEEDLDEADDLLRILEQRHADDNVDTHLPPHYQHQGKVSPYSHGSCASDFTYPVHHRHRAVSHEMFEQHWHPYAELGDIFAMDLEPRPIETTNDSSGITANKLRDLPTFPVSSSCSTISMSDGEDDHIIEIEGEPTSSRRKRPRRWETNIAANSSSSLRSGSGEDVFCCYKWEW